MQKFLNQVFRKFKKIMAKKRFYPNKKELYPDKNRVYPKFLIF